MQAWSPPGVGGLNQPVTLRYRERHCGVVLRCAFENSEVHVVVICDGPTGPAILALYCGLFIVLVLAIFKSPDTSTEALSDTAVFGSGW